ncbi:hypothetical protein JD969_14655 [Planctomycetota bacterium]|nr:hypothetical protein JD969_14655 [Planctomycetota bacterium]
MIIFSTIFIQIFIVLAIRAYRGKRIDNHPLCRSCKYDLTGIHTPYDACPECGYDISSPKLIRRGNRKPRPTHAITYIILALLFTSPIVIQSAHINIHRYKPFFILTFELANPSFAINHKAVHEELIARVNGSTTTPEEENQLFTIYSGLATQSAYLQSNAHIDFDATFQLIYKNNSLNATNLATYFDDIASRIIASLDKPRNSRETDYLERGHTAAWKNRYKQIISNPQYYYLHIDSQMDQLLKDPNLDHNVTRSFIDKLLNYKQERSTISKTNKSITKTYGLYQMHKYFANYLLILAHANGHLNENQQYRLVQEIVDLSCTVYEFDMANIPTVWSLVIHDKRIAYSTNTIKTPSTRFINFDFQGLYIDNKFHKYAPAWPGYFNIASTSVSSSNPRVRDKVIPYLNVRFKENQIYALRLVYDVTLFPDQPEYTIKAQVISDLATFIPRRKKQRQTN